MNINPAVTVVGKSCDNSYRWNKHSERRPLRDFLAETEQEYKGRQDNNTTANTNKSAYGARDEA